MAHYILSILIVLCVSCPAMAAGIDGTVSLKESVVTSVKQHPKIKAILYNREAVSKNLQAALGRFLPSLDVDSSYGFQQYDSTTTRTNRQDQRVRTASDTTVAMSLNVFDGLDRYYTYEGSKDRLKSAEFRLLDNLEAIGLDAVHAHHNVVRERNLLKLAEDNIVNHRELLESINERVTGGAASKADQMQAMSRLARAETTLIKYEGKLENAEASYYRLTGNEPGVLQIPEYRPALLQDDVKKVLNATLANNPKIMVGKSDVDASRKDSKVMDADYYPDVDVVVSTRNTDHLDGSNSYLQDNRAMLEMSWNLFRGGTDYNEAKAAKYRVKEAKSDLRDTVERIRREVSTAWSDYKTAVRQVDNYEKALGYSIETRDMYLVQFNVGQRSLLDVLDSINEVFSNSVLLETARINRSFSVYKLLALQGRLIRQLEVPDKTYEVVEK